MNGDLLTIRLRDHALASGIDLLGITSAKPFVKRNGKEKTVDPKDLLADARAVVSTAFYMNEDIPLPPDDRDHPRGRFTYGYSVRAFTAMENHHLSVIKGFLKKQGYRAAANRRYRIPDKMAAARAGIGKYGKNSVILTKEFGSCVMFVTLVTDAPLAFDDHEVNASDCRKCDLCIRSCPTGAIQAPFKVKRKLCITDWLWGEFVPIPLREKQGSRLFGCGECIRVCPRNKKLTPRMAYPVAAEDTGTAPELIPLVRGEKEYYKKTMAKFPMRAGMDALRGNAIIALGNLRTERAVGPLLSTLNHPKPRIRAYSAWALGRIGGNQAQKALRSALESEEDRKVQADIRHALDNLS